MMSKGDTLLSKGNKILEKTTLFGFGKIKKYEDAIELFTKAGYAFKIENDLESAGNAFLKASKYIKQIPDDMNYSYMNTLINAANCFKKINSVKAIKILNRIVDINNEDGRFAASAKYYQEMGEIYETCENPIGAMEAYQHAVDLLNAAHKIPGKNDCLIKIATIASVNGDFYKAAGIFESIAQECLNHRLLSYSARGYILQCCLCYLAMGDSVATKNKLECFINVDSTFSSSRECDFLDKLLFAFDNNLGNDYFSNICINYDRITPLDSWKTNILLKVKTHIDSFITPEEDINLC